MSAATELKAIKNQLADYFNKLSLNLDSPVSGLPSFEDYIAAIVYDATYTDALQGENRASSYSTAALVDAVHLFAAINREFSMRRQIKSDYFTASVDDTDKIVAYIETLYGKYLNYYRGTSPEQIRE